MTKSELSQALAMAQRNEGAPADEFGDLFMGFRLPDFKPVVCTMRHLAGLVAYQCIQFNGGIDAEALNEIAHWGRKRFLVV